MFRWIFSDTEEIAELLVMLIGVFIGELQNKGGDVLRDEIKAFEHVKNFSGKSPSSRGEGYCFYFRGSLREVFFDVKDERKIDGSVNLSITCEDGRYYGFGLFCDLLTGVVTVDARDSTFVSIDGKRATRTARKLCKAFARKYRNATSGTIVDWQRVLSGRI